LNKKFFRNAGTDTNYADFVSLTDRKFLLIISRIFEGNNSATAIKSIGRFCCGVDRRKPQIVFHKYFVLTFKVEDDVRQITGYLLIASLLLPR